MITIMDPLPMITDPQGTIMITIMNIMPTTTIMTMTTIIMIMGTGTTIGSTA